MINKIELHKIYKKKDLELIGIKYSSKNKERILNTLGEWYSIDGKGNKGKGTSVVFTKVFEEQKEKEDNRGKSEGSRGQNQLPFTHIITPMFGKFLNDVLGENEEYIITTKNLAYLLNIANANYLNKDCLKNFLDLKGINNKDMKSIVSDYLAQEQTNKRNQVESILKRLYTLRTYTHKRILIVEAKKKKIITKDGITKTIIMDKGQHIIADEELVKVVENAEANALLQLNMAQYGIHFAYNCDRADLFTKTVRDLANKEIVDRDYVVGVMYKAFEIKRVPQTDNFGTQKDKVDSILLSLLRKEYKKVGLTNKEEIQNYYNNLTNICSINEYKKVNDLAIKHNEKRIESELHKDLNSYLTYNISDDETISAREVLHQIRK